MSINFLRSVLGCVIIFMTTAGPIAVTPAPAKIQHAVLAGGCFWGMEAVFERLKGVKSVIPGYSGGLAEAAHYDEVSTGATGHAESIDIIFDPARISYKQLLVIYFTVAHDPTKLDRQGFDQGSQYRSQIFYANTEQRRFAEATIAALERAHRFPHPIVTQLAPLKRFFPAEAYHRRFYDLYPDNPYIVEEDVPKVHALEAAFPHLVVGRGQLH